MSFLTPLFWIAATVIAVPIFLHLTRRNVKRPIPFASLMFLQRIPFQETRRRRIRNLPLLLLRCLALLLLVAAFAQPITEGLFSSDRTTAAESVVVLVDRSMSMGRSEVWEQAVASTLEILSSLRPGDEVCLIGFGATSEVLASWTRDFASVQERARETLQAGGETTSYGEALRQAGRQLETATAPRQRVVLVTDLQSGGLDLSRLGLTLPEGVEFDVRDVGRDDVNLFVEQVRVQREIFGDRYPFTLVARIAASVPSGQEAQLPGGEARLYVGETLVDRRSFELAGSRAATVAFEAFDVPEGITRGRVVVHPGDSLPADDSRYFMIERAEPFQISLVSGPEAEGDFFEKAVSAGRNLPFRVTRTGQLSSLPEESSVLVVENQTRLPDLGALRAYVEAGHGLILMAGSEAGAWSRLGDQGLLPATLVEKRFASAQGDRFVPVTETMEEHPVFAPFRGLEGDFLASVQFYGYWKAEPVESATVLARFAGGDPFLIEREVGQGRVFLLTTSLARTWTDFPLRSSFLPFCQSLVQYAAGWSPRPAGLLIGESVSFREWAGLDPGTEGHWEVIDPRGRRLTTLGGERPDFFRLELPGYYELRWSKRTDWIASNVDPAESELQRVDREELLAALGHTRHRSPETRLTSMAGREDGESVWWLFLAAAALLFLVESIVANYSSRSAVSVGADGLREGSRN